VRKSGAWYTYDGDQLGQGKENARNFLIENPDVAAEIENKILVKLGIGEAGKAASAAAAAAEPVAAATPAKAAPAKVPLDKVPADKVPAEESFPESIDDELVARMAVGE